MAKFRNISSGTLELLDENGARVLFGSKQERDGMSMYLYKFTKDGGSTQPSLVMVGDATGPVPAPVNINTNLIGNPPGPGGIRRMIVIDTAGESADKHRAVDSSYLGFRETESEDAEALATELATTFAAGVDVDGNYLNSTTGDLFVVTGGIAHNYAPTGGWEIGGGEVNGL